MSSQSSRIETLRNTVPKIKWNMIEEDIQYNLWPIYTCTRAHIYVYTCTSIHAHQGSNKILLDFLHESINQNTCIWYFILCIWNFSQIWEIVYIIKIKMLNHYSIIWNNKKSESDARGLTINFVVSKTVLERLYLELVGKSNNREAHRYIFILWHTCVRALWNLVIHVQFTLTVNSRLREICSSFNVCGDPNLLTV